MKAILYTVFIVEHVLGCFEVAMQFVVNTWEEGSVVPYRISNVNIESDWTLTSLIEKEEVLE